MVNSFYYLRGGRERCFFDLMDLLTAHGHEVIPFSMEHEANFPSEYASYFVSNVDFPNRLHEKQGRIQTAAQVVERVIYFRESKEKIERLIADTQPELAHVHGFMHELSPSILTAIRAAGIPVVQTLHDYKMLCPNTNFVSQGEVCERCKGHRYYNAVLRRCKRDSLPASLLASAEMYIHKLLRLHEEQVDMFISPSQFLQQKALEHGVQKPIFNIPNFIDVDAFQPCYESENYFIYAGRLVDVKGINTLIRAMRQVRGARLYVAGWGDLEDTLRTYVRENGMDNVTFLGHLATPDLISLVQRAAFTVVPSEWYENYSMSVIESLACGTPVIGARIGGIPEQIIDGWNGLLFEPGNATELAQKIQCLLDQPGLAGEMGRNGRERVEEINNPETHYAQTMAVYERLLQNEKVLTLM